MSFDEVLCWLQHFCCLSLYIMLRLDLVYFRWWICSWIRHYEDIGCACIQSLHLYTGSWNTDLSTTESPNLFYPFKYWINFIHGPSFVQSRCVKTMTMLRRKSEFFVFLDSARSVKSEKEARKEEHQLSPHEEYLQALLQMKMTSAVSEQRCKIILVIKA